MFSLIGGGDLVYYALLAALIAESVEHTVLFVISAVARSKLTATTGALSISTLQQPH